MRECAGIRDWTHLMGLPGPSSRSRAELRRSAEAFAASFVLHGLMLLACLSLLRTKPVLEADEGVPVEIWTPAQMDALARREDAAHPTEKAEPLPAPTARPAETPPSSADGPGPRASETIRAPSTLSGQVLAHPLSRAMRQALSRFDEETRVEQLCGIEAMAQIAALKQFQPDRVVAYAMADVRLERNTLLAEGAAFRSRRRWYRLRFKCELNADRQGVRGFEYAIGDAIPRRLWEAHNIPAIH